MAEGVGFEPGRLADCSLGPLRKQLGWSDGHGHIAFLPRGVPLRVVMEVLGHSKMSTTADIYAHVLPVLMADAADKMNGVLTAS